MNIKICEKETFVNQGFKHTLNSIKDEFYGKQKGVKIFMKCIGNRCLKYEDGVFRPHCKLSGFPIDDHCKIEKYIDDQKNKLDDLISLHDNIEKENKIKQLAKEIVDGAMKDFHYDPNKDPVILEFRRKMKEIRR